MFSSRYFARKIQENLRHHPYWTKKRLIVHGLAAFVLLMILWVFSSLGALRTFLPHLFQITGLPGSERTYLILFQNDTELRPTGGFITSYALLTFHHGLPTGISFQDVYGTIDDHAYLTPPYPLDVLLEKDSETYNGHSFRDANMHPDFTQSKTEIVQFFHLTNPNTSISGVWAVNFSVLEDLTQLYGPLTVDNETLTRTTLFETLENEVSDIDRHNLEALSGRKSIIKSFAGVVVRHMIFNPWKWRELSELVVQNLNEKSILLTFENASLSRKMAQFHWDGHLPPENPKSPTDRLVVNVANYGGMKSDRYITREVHYGIEVTDAVDNSGRVIYGNLEVKLDHHGEYNTPLSGQYKGYLRVFLPLGVQLLESSTGVSDSVLIDGYQGWGDFILMQPGESQTFSYRFRLNSAYLVNNHYRLEVIKQSGTDGDFYEIEVKTPRGHDIEGTRFLTRENVALYRTFLHHDESLEWTMLEDTMQPRLFEHKLVELNVIQLNFAEPLDLATAIDPVNYQILDLNKTIPGVNDQIRLKSIEVEGGQIRLITTGMTEQNEEFYQVLLRNIRDTSGNPIEPNPRTVTVVQRFE